MPLASLVSAASMALFGANFNAAQLPSVVALAGLVALTGWLGFRLAARGAMAGWPDCWFCSAAFFSRSGPIPTPLRCMPGRSRALAALGLGRQQRDRRWFALSGALAALAHLTRADGYCCWLWRWCWRVAVSTSSRGGIYPAPTIKER